MLLFLHCLMNIEGEEQANLFKQAIKEKKQGSVLNAIAQGKNSAHFKRMRILLNDGIKASRAYEYAARLNDPLQEDLLPLLAKKSESKDDYEQLLLIKDPRQAKRIQAMLEKKPSQWNWYRTLKIDSVLDEFKRDRESGIFDLKHWTGASENMTKSLELLLRRYSNDEDLIYQAYRIAEKKHLYFDYDRFTMDIYLRTPQSMPGKIKVNIPDIRIKESLKKVNGKNPIDTSMSKMIGLALISGLKEAQTAGAVEIEVVGQNVVNSDLLSRLRELGFHKRVLDAARDYEDSKYYRANGIFVSQTFHRPEAKIDWAKRTLSVMKKNDLDITPSEEIIRNFTNPYPHQAVSVLVSRSMGVRKYVEQVSHFTNPYQVKAFEILVDGDQDLLKYLPYFSNINNEYQTQLLSILAPVKRDLTDVMKLLPDIQNPYQLKAGILLQKKTGDAFAFTDWLRNVKNASQVSELETILEKKNLDNEAIKKALIK